MIKSRYGKDISFLKSKECNKKYPSKITKMRKIFKKYKNIYFYIVFDKFDIYILDFKNISEELSKNEIKKNPGVLTNEFNYKKYDDKSIFSLDFLDNVFLIDLITYRTS